MRKDTLLRFVEKVGLKTGALESFYDFSGSTDSSNKDNFYKLTSGASNSLDTYVIYNRLHSTGSQISGAVSPLINVHKSPAVITPKFIITSFEVKIILAFICASSLLFDFCKM